MDKVKFSQMLARFPFIEGIIKEAVKEMKWGKDFVKFIEDVRVGQADERLLKSQPIDLIASDRLFVQGGSWLCHCHYFWFVSLAEVIRLKEKVMKDYKDKSIKESAALISGQLLDLLDKDIQYIVEFDHEVCQGQIIGPIITIYEMRNLAWRDLCRKTKSGEKS